MNPSRGALKLVATVAVAAAMSVACKSTQGASSSLESDSGLPIVKTWPDENAFYEDGPETDLGALVRRMVVGILQPTPQFKNITEDDVTYTGWSWAGIYGGNIWSYHFSVTGGYTGYFYGQQATLSVDPDASVGQANVVHDVGIYVYFPQYTSTEMSLKDSDGNEVVRLCDEHGTPMLRAAQ